MKKYFPLLSYKYKNFPSLKNMQNLIKPGLIIIDKDGNRRKVLKILENPKRVFLTHKNTNRIGTVKTIEQIVKTNKIHLPAILERNQQLEKSLEEIKKENQKLRISLIYSKKK